jgi:hypothetical protein
VSGAVLAQQPEPFVPAPARDIPNYWESELPCEVRKEKVEDGRVTGQFLSAQEAERWDGEVLEQVYCKEGGPRLQDMKLRELSLLRNTIFARYGWARFRKRWLREHFQQQPWYKPNPKFSYQLLSEADRKNLALIARAEMSRRYVDLEWARDELLARAGKRWADAPITWEDTGETRGCSLPRGLEAPSPAFEQKLLDSKDCRHHRQGYLEPAEPDLRKLSPEERIELGLISRAMGDFAEDEDQRTKVSKSLDEVLSVKELRKLSPRDLRLLRNTVYARRGRPFKSELLQAYFNQRPWYRADPEYTDARLTRTDLRNIKLIRSVEEELGGALNDSDFLMNNPSSSEDPLSPSQTV